MTIIDFDRAGLKETDYSYWLSANWRSPNSRWGAWFRSWKFAPRWSLSARVGYFTLDYDKYSGDMTNAHVMVNYSISQRWALGASYQFVDLDLEVDKTDYVEIYDIDFAGPMAFALFRF